MVPKHKEPMKKQHITPVTFFDNINTEYKAYMLGLTYADGTIDDKVKGLREWRFRISLQLEDIEVLKPLAKIINKKVNIYHPPAVKSKGWKPRATITINNTFLCKSLIDLGCYPRKSQEGMKFPDLKSEFIPHFIRGFFDGDGSVVIKNRKYKGKKTTSVYQSLRIAFSSTDSAFLDVLISHLPITKIYKSKRKRTLTTYTYWVERKQDVENVYNYMYKNSTVYMKRKINKFNMLIKSEAEDTSSERLETT